MIRNNVLIIICNPGFWKDRCAVQPQKTWLIFSTIAGVVPSGSTERKTPPCLLPAVFKHGLNQKLLRLCTREYPKDVPDGH